MEAAKLLTKAGTDLSTEDGWGRTPLSVASASGQIHVVQAVLPHYDR